MQTFKTNNAFKLLYVWEDLLTTPIITKLIVCTCLALNDTERERGGNRKI